MIKDHILQHPSFGDSHFRCTVCGQEWPIGDGVLEQIKQSICVKAISIGDKPTCTFVTQLDQILKGK